MAPTRFESNRASAASTTTTTRAGHGPSSHQSVRSRLPSGLPKFKRPTSQDPNSADDFLSEFERRLAADGYPLETYPEALAACCLRLEGDWVCKPGRGKDSNGSMLGSSSSSTLSTMIFDSTSNKILFTVTAVKGNLSWRFLIGSSAL